MLRLEVGFAGGDSQIAVGHPALGTAIFYRPVSGRDRRATAEGLSLSHSPSRPQEQDAEIARRDNRQKGVCSEGQDGAAAQDSRRYTDDHDSIGASLDAGTGEGLGGWRGIRRDQTGADLRIVEGHRPGDLAKWHTARGSLKFLWFSMLMGLSLWGKT